MIRRTVKLQLLAFAVITVLGVAYTGLNYVGLGQRFVGNPYDVTAKLADSGGLFVNAQVTYRGVTVGKVQALRLAPDGVDAVLRIDNGTDIPKQGVRAVVGNLSAVGEQFIDLQPQGRGKPYLQDGDVIAQDATTLPVSNAELLFRFDRFINSLDQQNLTIVIDELDKAFSDTAPDLARIIRDGNQLNSTLIDALPETEKLINDGRTVLDTQRVIRGDLKTFAANLAQLTDQIRRSDPDIRAVFDNGIRSSRQLTGFVNDIDGPLPVLVDNLLVGARIQAVPVRLDGLRTIFTVYPINVFNGQTVAPGDGTAHFGLVPNNDDNICTTYADSADAPGYIAPDRQRDGAGRSASQFGGASKDNVYCLAPRDSQTTPRGARNAPRPPGDTTGGPPYPVVRLPGEFPDNRARMYPGHTEDKTPGVNGSSAAPTAAGTYDPVTNIFVTPDGTSYELGSTGGQQAVMGDSSWTMLLLSGVTK